MSKKAGKKQKLQGLACRQSAHKGQSRKLRSLWAKMYGPHNPQRSDNRKKV